MNVNIASSIGILLDPVGSLVSTLWVVVVVGGWVTFLDPVGSLVSTLWVVGWLVVVTLFLNL